MSRRSLRYTVALSVYTIKYLSILRLVCALHHRHSSLRRSGAGNFIDAAEAGVAGAQHSTHDNRETHIRAPRHARAAPHAASGSGTCHSATGGAHVRAESW